MKKKIIKSILYSVFFLCICAHAHAQRYTSGSFGIQTKGIFKDTGLTREDFAVGVFYNLETYKRFTFDMLRISSFDRHMKKNYIDYIGSFQYQFNLLQALNHLINLNGGVGLSLGYRHIKNIESLAFFSKGSTIYGPSVLAEIQIYILGGLSFTAESRISWLGHLIKSPWLIISAIGLRYEFF